VKKLTTAVEVVPQFKKRNNSSQGFRFYTSK